MLHSFPRVLFGHQSASGTPRRASLGRMVNQSTMLLMVAIGSLIIILALMILFHQNANATKGYLLRTLERERSQLLLEEETLKMKLAEAQSLGTLEGDKKIQTMISARDMRYAEASPAVAVQP